MKTAKASRNKKRPSRSSKGGIQTKDQLLHAARKLFAARGLRGTTIRDIAGEAKINSSMISYYFGSKENLYKQCLEDIAEARLKLAQQILRPPKSIEEFRVHLSLFMDNLMSLLIEDRDTGLILMREFDRTHSPAEKVFQKGFKEFFELVVDFFKGAQKNKVIANSKDPFILANLFFGCLTSQMRMDAIRKKLYNRSLIELKDRKNI